MTIGQTTGCARDLTVAATINGYQVLIPWPLAVANQRLLHEGTVIVTGTWDGAGRLVAERVQDADR